MSSQAHAETASTGWRSVNRIFPQIMDAVGLVFAAIRVASIFTLLAFFLREADKPLNKMWHTGLELVDIVDTYVIIYTTSTVILVVSALPDMVPKDHTLIKPKLVLVRIHLFLMIFKVITQICASVIFSIEMLLNETAATFWWMLLLFTTYLAIDVCLLYVIKQKERTLILFRGIPENMPVFYVA